MKKYLHYFLCAAAIAAFAACSDDDDDVVDDSVFKKDSVFTTYCLEHFDSNRNGIIEVEEVDTVTRLDVHDMDITSLEGIENFTALIWLDCYRNRLTELDVSKNTALKWLNCNYNRLTELDISKNTALTDLYCYYNQLTELDVSKNTALTCLDCASNQLTELNISKNTALTDLYCFYNQLTELDISNTNLINCERDYPLICSPMETLQTLYLKTGWKLEDINQNRNEQWIPAQTEIKYKN